MFVFKFVNHSMPSDTVQPNTEKVLVYKEINVTAATQKDARIKAYRPKTDLTGVLDPEWQLVSAIACGRCYS